MNIPIPDQLLLESLTGVDNELRTSRFVMNITGELSMMYIKLHNKITKAGIGMIHERQQYRSYNNQLILEQE